MAIANFVEKRFPEDVSYGAKGGPKFKTEIFTAASGAEQRNSNWQDAKAEYDVGFGIRDKVDMDDVLKFFYMVRGRATGFRYKDWTDYECVNEQIGVGDGTTKTFQMTKTYDLASGQPYIRKIVKIDPAIVTGVTVGGLPLVENTDFTVDRNTGIFTFNVAPGSGVPVIIGVLEFDTPVRFDVDKIDIVAEAWNMESWPSIKLVEVLDYA